MKSRSRKPNALRNGLLLLLVIGIIAGITLYIIPNDQSESGSSDMQAEIAKPASDSADFSEAATAQTEKEDWQAIAISKGDSLSKIFKELNLSQNELLKLMHLATAKQYLRRLHPGDMISVKVDEHGKLKALRYPIENSKTILFTANDSGFSSKLIEKKFETAMLYRTGTIKTTFAEAAQKAGLNHHLRNQLRTIFAGKINYARDLRRGDTFHVLYREYYIDGKKDHTGNIMVAEFVNKNKSYTAVNFSYPRNHTGYFTPNGHGIEPKFLRAPLHYKRISSRFTFLRKDPYLHKWRSHLGVDYAAHYGTPVRALADGRIIFRGRKGGYGNAIVVRFDKKYKALYGHLSRFAHNLHRNQYVHKGQVIGYVGSTGWSTGPHLHLSFYKYGVPRNYLAMKILGGKSVPSSYHKKFIHHAQNLLAQLETHKSPQLADNRDLQTTHE